MSSMLPLVIYPSEIDGLAFIPFICRYQFENTLTSTNSILSRALGKIDPAIDMQGVHHQSSFYRGKVGHDTFILVQDGDKDPPVFPNVRGASDLWDKIRIKDATETDKYILRVYMVLNHHTTDICDDSISSFSCNNN